MQEPIQPGDAVVVAGPYACRSDRHFDGATGRLERWGNTGLGTVAVVRLDRPERYRDLLSRPGEPFVFLEPGNVRRP